MTDSTSSIQYKVIHEGDAPALWVRIPKGQSIFAEAGAMLSMSPTVMLRGTLRGGLLGGLSRKLLRGETFFFQTLKADTGDAEVLLAPAPPGEILILDMDGAVQYFIQKGSFLAAEQTVTLKTKMQNLTKGLFSGEGFFISKAFGKGKLILNSFGAIHQVELGPGEEYIVDNHHLMAWTSTTSYRITRASSRGWIASFFSGEGFVCRFKGPGTLYIQTRNPTAFVGWIGSFMPRRG